MSTRSYATAALLAAFAILPAAPALAAGEILITHAKALAGGVTPTDLANYPITISTPGAYELASNLVVPADKIGIHVTSPNVSIDLNGFTIFGSSVAWVGITGSVDAVTIENGTIRSFKYDGINGTGNFWVVDKIRSVANGRDGIVVGQFALIDSSIAVFNGARGIKAAFSAVISGSNASANQTDGIETARSSVVGNAINSNQGTGLKGGTTTGYSGNTLVGNATAASGVVQQHPNDCHPAVACP